MTVQREKGEGQEERKGGKERTGQDRKGKKESLADGGKQRHTINLDPIHMKAQHLANVP